jgi:predicted dehydrogenase
MIAQNYRFGPQPRTSRRVLAEGIIGAPGQCDIRFYMPWADIPNSHYVNEPFMVINDMMVHHFDLMRYVLGHDPQSVQAITWNQPWGWHKGDASHAIIFRYEDGFVATHVACCCDVGLQTSWNGDWHIAGSNGSLDWDAAGTWYSHQHRTQTPVTRQAVAHDEVPEPEQAILTEFLSALEEDREPECSARDNLKSLTMVFGAIQSAKENRIVQLSEVE